MVGKFVERKETPGFTEEDMGSWIRLPTSDKIDINTINELNLDDLNLN